MEQSTNVLGLEELHRRGAERTEEMQTVKERLHLATQVLARYNKHSSRMQMALDIARLEYLISKYQGVE